MSTIVNDLMVGAIAAQATYAIGSMAFADSGGKRKKDRKPKKGKGKRKKGKGKGKGGKGGIGGLGGAVKDTVSKPTKMLKKTGKRAEKAAQKLPLVGGLLSEGGGLLGALLNPYPALGGAAAMVVLTQTFDQTYGLVGSVAVGAVFAVLDEPEGGGSIVGQLF